MWNEPKGCLITDEGYEIFIYNIILKFNPDIVECWLDIAPSPETHDLYHINQGIDIEGEAYTLLQFNNLIGKVLKFGCEFSSYKIRMQIIIYEIDFFKIKFRNIDRQFNIEKI